MFKVTIATAIFLVTLSAFASGVQILPATPEIKLALAEGCAQAAVAAAANLVNNELMDDGVDPVSSLVVSSLQQSRESYFVTFLKDDKGSIDVEIHRTNERCDVVSASRFSLQ